MNYLDINKFNFNDEKLRGFIINSIDNIDIRITDIEVTFQKNRAIVCDIVIESTEIIKYLNDNNSINLIKGQYYHYSFVATVDNFNNTGFHHPFFNYKIVIDLIEFSKENNYFINSKLKKEIQIIPTNNMIKYMERIKKKDLFSLENISFEEYNSKFRYLLELNSFIYDTPILIEKVIIKLPSKNNILFQSQYINKNAIKKLDENYLIILNGHFTNNLNKYLDNYIYFKIV